MGWKSERTPWDILPIVVSANGHDPDYFDLPRSLVMEVELIHPKYVYFSSIIDHSAMYNTRIPIFSDTIGSKTSICDGMRCQLYQVCYSIVVASNLRQLHSADGTCQRKLVVEIFVIPIV